MEALIRRFLEWISHEAYKRDQAELKAKRVKLVDELSRIGYSEGFISNGDVDVICTEPSNPGNSPFVLHRDSFAWAVDAAIDHVLTVAPMTESIELLSSSKERDVSFYPTLSGCMAATGQYKCTRLTFICRDKSGMGVYCFTLENVGGRRTARYA